MLRATETTDLLLNEIFFWARYSNHNRLNLLILGIFKTANRYQNLEIL